MRRRNIHHPVVFLIGFFSSLFKQVNNKLSSVNFQTIYPPTFCDFTSPVSLSGSLVSNVKPLSLFFRPNVSPFFLAVVFCLRLPCFPPIRRLNAICRCSLHQETKAPFSSTWGQLEKKKKKTTPVFSLLKEEIHSVFLSRLDCLPLFFFFRERTSRVFILRGGCYGVHVK